MTGILLALGAAVLLALTLPGTLELCLLIVGSLRRLPQTGACAEFGAIAVVVPAHNEATGLRATLENLLEHAAADGNATVVVVADNCDDATADIAAEMGTRVLERRDTALRGKGYALDFAFRRLLEDNYAGFLVVDADSRLQAGFLAEIRRCLSTGADAVQARYTVLNPRAGLRTRLMHVALLAFNVFRPRGRAGLGLSAGILGNGFALSRAALLAVPYTAASVVEDLEYHLRLVAAGKKVVFADGAAVAGEMPLAAAAARTQRARWEGGRLRMAGEHMPWLLKSVLRGNWRLAEPLLDLALLPLAFHCALLILALAWPVPWLRLYACVALGAVVLHLVIALRLGRAGLSEAAALLLAPFYLLWKLALLFDITRSASRRASWQRTPRNAEKSKPEESKPEKSKEEPT